MPGVPGAKRPTIADVAIRAGVSRTTVSRVLNGRGELTAETVARVHRAIDELGYRPSEIARSLSFQRTRTIGFVVYDILNPGMAECVYAAQVELAKRDYQLILTCMAGQIEAGQACLRLLEDRRVDGIITGSLPRTEAFDANGLPRPVLDGVFCYHPATGRVSTVSFDEGDGARQVASHLSELGHRRIGVVTGPNWWGCIQERLAAFQETLAALNVPFDPSLIEMTNEWTVPAGHAATVRLLERAPDLTAIWALYDVLAIGVVRALHDLGRRIPDDVAVIGFNDEVFSTYTVPRITSVRANCSQLGQIAARLILELIDDEAAQPREVVIPTQLVVRESTTGETDATEIAGESERYIPAGTGPGAN